MDMSPLKEKINELLNCSNGFQIWFGIVMHYSLVDNCTDNYHDLSDIADASLDMAATTLEVNLKAKEKKEALETIKKLSAFDDVPKRLMQLKEKRISSCNHYQFTLTNTYGTITLCSTYELL